jgi:hypothetical protein
MKKISHFLYQHPIASTVVIVLILIAVKFFVFEAMENDHYNKVVPVHESKQPGFQVQPGYVKIEASRSKIIADSKDIGWYNGMNVLAWIACFAPLIWIKLFDGKEKDAPAWGLFFFIAVWFTITFLPTSIRAGRVEYETKICEKNYLKGQNYDHLFPETKDQTQSLDEFLNTCR